MVPIQDLTHSAVLNKNFAAEGGKIKQFHGARNSFPEEQEHTARSLGLTELQEAQPVT